MKAEQILEAMSYLDDELLAEAASVAADAIAQPAPAAESGVSPQEADEKAPAVPFVRWARWLAAAAVFVLLLAGVHFALKRQPKTPDGVNGSVTAATEPLQTAVGESAKKTASPEQLENETTSERTAAGTEQAGRKTETASALGAQTTKTARSTNAATGTTRAAGNPSAHPTAKQADSGSTAGPRPSAEKHTETPTFAVSTTDSAASTETNEKTLVEQLIDFLAPGVGKGAGIQRDALRLQRLFGEESGNAADAAPQTEASNAAETTGRSDGRTMEPTANPSEGADTDPLCDPEDEVAGPPTSADKTPRGNSGQSDNAFGTYCALLLQTEARLQTCEAVRKTVGELEAIYGGRFLPTVFPGTDSAPAPQTTPHGVYYEDGKNEPTVLNRYEYQWNGTSGGDYRLLLYAVKDDGSYPAAELSAQEPYQDANGVRIFFRCDTAGVSPYYTALARRGDTVLWLTLHGNCTQTAFLQLVRSALGA